MTKYVKQVSLEILTIAYTCYANLPTEFPVFFSIVFLQDNQTINITESSVRSHPLPPTPPKICNGASDLWLNLFKYTYGHTHGLTPTHPYSSLHTHTCTHAHAHIHTHTTYLCGETQEGECRPSLQYIRI